MGVDNTSAVIIGVRQYPDIKKLLSCAENILSETFYLKRCYYAAIGNDSYIIRDYSNFRQTDLSGELIRLTEEFNAAQGNIRAPVYKEFRLFMEQVILPERIVLTDKDSEDICRLVSVLSCNTGEDCMGYYYCLINYHNP